MIPKYFPPEESARVLARTYHVYYKRDYFGQVKNFFALFSLAGMPRFRSFLFVSIFIIGNLIFHSTFKRRIHYRRVVVRITAVALWCLPSFSWAQSTHTAQLYYAYAHADRVNMGNTSQEVNETLDAFFEYISGTPRERFSVFTKEHNKAVVMLDPYRDHIDEAPWDDVRATLTQAFIEYNRIFAGK